MTRDAVIMRKRSAFCTRGRQLRMAESFLKEGLGNHVHDAFHGQGRSPHSPNRRFPACYLALVLSDEFELVSAMTLAQSFMLRTRQKVR